MSRIFDTFHRWKLDQTRSGPDCCRCVHLTRHKSPDEWLGECNLSGRLIQADRLPKECASFYTPNMDA